MKEEEFEQRNPTQENLNNNDKMAETLPVDLEHALENSKSPEDLALENISDKYGETFDLENKVDEMEKTAQKDKATLKSLRESAGVPATDTETTTDKYLAGAKSELENKIENIEKLEDDFLEAPANPKNAEKQEKSSENKDDNQENARLKELEEQMRGASEAVLEFENEMKEARKKSVEDFIERNIRGAKSYFDGELSASQNGPKAERLMETKIRLTIMNGAVDWVENGGERDLGFEVSLETVSDKDENNETKIYITGIEVKMAAEIGTDTEEKLLNEDESEDVNSKEKAGDLKRQEKTA